MENNVRSERSRKIIIEAALAVLAREGPHKLTIEGIAQEGGISKGRIMHHFRTKAAVVEALLEHQADCFDRFEEINSLTAGPENSEAQLSEQILAWRASINVMQSLVTAAFGAMVTNPDLNSGVRRRVALKVQRIQDEASDPDLALLRWQAARGMALATKLGICPLSADERSRLFDRLLDMQAWELRRLDSPPPPPPSAA